MGRLTLYIATSVDGFVATADGGVEWLEAYHGEDASDYEAFFDGVDCLLVGARTYEQILGFGEWPYGEVPTFVLTHRDLPQASEAVEFVAGDVEDVADHLTDGYDHVWLVGGPDVARQLLRAGRVDELRLNIVPTVLGRGVPLFEDTATRLELDLVETATYGTGIVELWYHVED